MAYFPPIGGASVRKAENRFLVFVGIASAGLVALVLLSTSGRHIGFWKGNTLWSLGSYLVFFTVVHTRFFDVRKHAAPWNGRLSPAAFRGFVRTLETLCSLLWMIGSALIVAARWIPY
jgi:hypothetical protein